MKMIPRGAIDKGMNHILEGVLLSSLGLWHLFNHITLFVSLPPPPSSSSSSSWYAAPAWFPEPRIRHLELIAMLVAGVYGFATQMFAYSPMPFAADGSIPPERLPNHEHAIVYALVLVYAGAAIYLDRRDHRQQRHSTLCMLLLAAVFAQQLFMFHVHSTDHAGVEGRFHWFLQAAAATCLAAALLGAAGRLPAELQFAVSVVRSASLAFQGIWGVVFGVVWIIPWMAPVGCSLDDGGVGMRCHGGEDSRRHAIAVVNLQFGWCMVLLTVIVLGIYLHVCKKYSADQAGEVYGRLPEAEADGGGNDEDDDDDHNMKKSNCNCNKQSVHGVHNEFTSMEIEV